MDGLSSDCLFAIFARFPMPELLSLRVLNSNWNFLINDHCSRTHSLQLFGSWYDQNRHEITIAKRHFSYIIDFGDLKARNAMAILKSADSKREAELQPFCIIPDTFPNIYNLMINNCQELYELHLPAMLKRWPKLTTLSLHSIPGPEKLHPLFWSSINALTCLRSLNLVHMFSSVLPAEFPALKYLSHFALVHYRGPVAPILAQLGPNCQSIVLCWVYLNFKHFESLLRINPHLAKRLEHLTLEYINSTLCSRMENFELILRLAAEHFTNLRSLNIMLADMPILSQLTTIKELSIHWVYLSAEQMAKAIEQNSNLKQLEMLYIGFIFSQNGDREKNYQHLFWFICQNFKALKKLDNQYGDQLDLSDIIHGLSELTSLAELWIYVGRHQLKQADLSSLPQLHSVKILRLEIFELTVEQFFTFTSRTFPNLEQLILRAPDFDATQQKTVLSRLSEAFPNLKMKKIKFA
ncbi:hypothetical protein TYRP_021453 [Tyrophagus putrescentiae]|nr:hypothetical protein TYRP_021453 [Tyrophagus putrescentiae]